LNLGGATQEYSYRVNPSSGSWLETMVASDQVRE